MIDNNLTTQPRNIGCAKLQNYSIDSNLKNFFFWKKFQLRKLKRSRPKIFLAEVVKTVKIKYMSIKEVT